MDNSFSFVIHEPFQDRPPQTFQEPFTADQTLATVLDRYRVRAGRCQSGPVSLPHYLWNQLIPQPGFHYEVYPEVQDKNFTSGYLQALNATHSSSTFVHAVEVVEDPITPVIHRFVSHPKSINFAGNDYEPIFMVVGGHEVAATMEIPQMTVTVPEANDAVIDWAEEIDIRGALCTVYTLSLDHLSGAANDYEHITLQVQLVSSNSQVVVFTLGLNFSLDDVLPREVMTPDEFPGIPTDTRGFPF